ncbi:MAG: hypothetical protein GIW99_09425 [Candidatus Eremiobacteraeota bacterium]|nr:hypothetical protein [Candidatus Eremiobacteraeota bacterium]MBC5827882.1 hypothetical protein [Candidatus Eremiobacteraeota bacterium]
MRPSSFRVLPITALLLLLPLQLAAAPKVQEPRTPAQSPKPAQPFERLQWRSIGPALSGGRVSAVAGTDADPELYYIGAAGGGVFKTADGGNSWQAVFEKQPVAAIGAIAIDSRDENDVWVGTGEANPRNDVSYGDGVWQTTDGGKKWQHRGLEGTSQISKILIDPRDRKVVLVGALGSPFKDSSERGVYRSADGGRTWQKTLYVGPQSGVSDMAWDPAHPDVVYAGIWQYRRIPWNLSSGGPADGLYKSGDGGRSWKKLTGHGLPPGLVGRIGIAVASSKPKRVYAAIQSRHGVLWRSDDGGDTWRLMTSDTIVTQRPFYFSHIYVDPKNADHVFSLALFLAQSKDGGKTFKAIHNAPHGDMHVMWIASGGKRMALGNDGGIDFSHDGGQSWFWDLNVAVGQIYHLGYDTQIPYNVCGGLQDNSGFCGPSNSLDPAGIHNRNWFLVNGGDGEWIWPDPLDAHLIWNDTENGSLAIYDTRTQEDVDISPYPRDTNGIAIADLPYRFNWDSPLAFSPQDPHVAYFGGNVVFSTRDRGQHWTVISPDLTLNDKSHQQVSGGPITLDVSGAEFSDTILDIAPSLKEPGLIWVGTDDGLVQLTRDGGVHWKNVTMSGVPPDGRVEAVEPSPHSAAMAFAVVDRHRSGDRAPYLFETDDYGGTWRSIASNLPRDQFVRVVRQDPRNPNLLYAGLEESMWASFDGGARWQRLQLNLPTASVRDLRVHPQANDLIAATHGRSLWILDDLTPLQQLDAAKSAGTYLFPPRTAYRFVQWSPQEGDPTSWSGDNPDYGALLSYYQSKKSDGAPTIDIIDAAGRVVRHLAGTHEVHDKPKPYVPNDAGISRIAWDLAEDPPVKWNGAAKWNRGPDDGAEAVPGTYTVRLHSNGQTLDRTLEVKADPHLNWTQAQAIERHDFIASQLGQLSRIDEALNRIDAIQRDLPGKIVRLRKAGASTAALAIAQSLQREAASLKSTLTSDPKNEEDSITMADKLRERLEGIAFGLGSSFSPPSAALKQQADEVRAQFDAAMASYNRLKGDLATLDAALSATSVSPLR